ncbi:MAG: long-chain acyl-CoA synthetase [Arenicella sp.]|jgi:long-chain acyl-CoA synthetase
MLIVGGFKVFSVELEDKLNNLDFVANTAVVGVADEVRQGNDIVNLFVELMPANVGDQHELLREQIIAYCREHMSPYKIPKKVHFIDAIPLTAIGKLDKKVLRERLENREFV